MIETTTYNSKPRADCHVRLYDSAGLVVAFDINGNAKDVAKSMFDTWVINNLSDDSPDDVGNAYTADGYYATG